jgi:hypothetical protein
MAKLAWLFVIYKFFKFVIPWLFRVAWFALKLVFLTMGNWIITIPRNVKAIASDWTHRAEVAGVSSEFDTELYYSSAFVAFVMTVLGWVLFAYLTVWLIHLIF